MPAPSPDRPHSIHDLDLRKAKPTIFSDRPFIYHRTHEMAAQAGIDTPQFVLLPTEFPFATRAPQLPGKPIAVSEGLLSLLTDREMVAVLGHEMSHVARAPAFEMSRRIPSAAAGVAAMGALDHYHQRAHPNNPAKQDEGMSRRMFMALPFCFATDHAATPPILRHYERLADKDAVILSGDKEALISAFRKISQWGKAHGYYVDAGSHPPFEERIAAIEGFQR